MIVLDASAAVEWLLGRTGAAKVAVLVADPERALHAPAHLPVEVASAVRGLVLGGHAAPERGRLALADLAGLDLHTHDVVPLLPRMWELRANLSAYDAAYVALAEVLDATVVTADARLAAAPDLGPDVVVVGEG